LKKYIIILLILLGLIISAGPASALPSISAGSAVLIDADTGKLLYEQSAWELRPPASTTKIITAILAIEHGNLNEAVEISPNAANTGEASIGLKPGEKLTMYNLLHGALLKSGNDACVAIAEHIAPSEEEFVGLMNLKARSLGAFDTTFFNTNGLPHTDHLTTAYDLAIITRYALNNKIFSEIVRKKDYTLQWETPPARRRYISNTNKLLWTYPPATGVKTGTTDSAGKCLVASAHEPGRSVIAVLLNSPRRFADARELLEYGLFQLK